ncbi:MAG TPA: hypothetical protein PLU67_04085 [Candidatus Kapabacteria bacterium]|jgi:Mor family transcriptional regulator|nr:hypothetical protein [Candidatus Kapabacteria bacterium]HOM04658.1 hypothetical protein [Candidatus Kapabacteria bacterium]HOQ49737.1 hypothetical protein [Candidatus Kapabacteria bacterium]HPP39598.1 hypothetical protein [Candidatus Kapabacteria bacterium]
MKEEVVRQIRLDELPENLCLLAEYCGLDAVQKMLLNLNGGVFYVPRISHLDKFVERYIKENWDKSTSELAKDLNVSLVHVRRMRKRIIEERRAEKKLSKCV